MKPAKTCKCCDIKTLKLIFRSASMFISQSPRTVNMSESSQSRTSRLRLRLRRCLTRGASFGLTDPLKRNRRGSDSESGSEPDSPRISCVGQIEIDKRRKKSKKKAKGKKMAVDGDNSKQNGWMWEKNKRKKSAKRTRKTMELEREPKNGAEGSSAGGETTPYLYRPRLFASGRGALSDFDWTLVGEEEESTIK